MLVFYGHLLHKSYEKVFKFNGDLHFSHHISQENKIEYRDNPLPAKYVLKSSRDTVFTHVVASYAFKKVHLTADTYLKFIRTVDENDKKTKVPSDNIKYLEIIDFDNTVRRFIASNNFTIFSKKKPKLLELLYKGSRFLVVKNEYTVSIYGNTASDFYTFEGGIGE